MDKYLRLVLIIVNLSKDAERGNTRRKFILFSKNTRVEKQYSDIL
jgi:hypothetical protein